MILRQGALRGAVLCASAFVAAACSLLLDTSHPQCATDDDCARRGGLFAASNCVSAMCVASGPEGATPDAGDPVWGCLGHYPAPTPSSVQAKYSLTLNDALTAAPVTTVRIRECPNATDPLCLNPVVTATPDANGVARFTLDTRVKSFDGYFAIDTMTADGGSPDAGVPGAYLPSRVYYTSVPITGDLADDYSLFTYSAVQTFLAVYQLGPIDPNAGIALLVAHDCRANNAPGVIFSIDAMAHGTRVFYFKGNEPSTSAVATDSSGIALFVNVPVGSRSFSAALASGRQPVGTFTGYFLAGTVSYAGVGPAFPSN